jgi:hypothetical protein
LTFICYSKISGAGDVYFQLLVGSNKNTSMVRYNVSDCNAGWTPGPSPKETCPITNITTNAPFVFTGKDTGFEMKLKEGFVAKPSTIGDNLGLIVGLIGGVGGLLIVAGLLFFCKNKGQKVDDIHNAQEEQIEMTQQQIEMNVVPQHQERRNLERSWIQKIARRANEFGRQVPEIIQDEAEVYDDYVDTVMTVVLWFALIGTFLFVILDEFTNPANLATAFCSEDRSSYCNSYYDYSDLATCGGEAGSTVGQADESNRRSYCGLRSNGDHALSILTNYGALSGLATSICRSIANNWKGCRRGKQK